MEMFTIILQGVLAPMARLGRSGGLGRMVSWVIRILIYDIIVTSLSNMLGVSRLTGCFILLGGMAVVSVGGYIVKHRMGGSADR